MPPTTFVFTGQVNFLDTIAWGLQSYEITNTAPGGNIAVGDYLQLLLTKTNHATVALAVTNSVTNTNLTELVQQLTALVAGNPSLQGSDGLAAEDLVATPDNNDVQFNLRALTEGYAAAQIQAELSGSADFQITPAGTGALTGNLGDLVPRNHLYVAVGVTNLSLTFSLDTTALPDGSHELAAVAYEGTHVRTQARVTQQILIRNTALSAGLTALVGGTNTALEAVLQFDVSANTNAVSQIQLFSTGGLLASATNIAEAVFSIAATNLGLGLHPFYAVVTGNTGGQYRTATLWIRIVGANSPFPLALTAPPPTLGWPAVAGRSYDILGAAAPNAAFQIRATVVPTNSAAQWRETNTVPAAQFYRVRASPFP